MTPIEVAAKLRAFSEWRRGDEDIPKPDPREIGEAIDAAVEMIDRLEAAEKELAELRSSMKFRTSLIGRTEAERDALRAKVEAMERQEPVAIVESWANGSYSRNYKLRWIKDAAEGANLYLAPGAQAQPAPSIPEAVMEVIAGLVYEVERNICPHEETHRGGQWEICDMCGSRWADDRGGKPEFKWPEVVEKARAMLAATPEAKP